MHSGEPKVYGFCAQNDTMEDFFGSPFYALMPQYLTGHPLFGCRGGKI